MKTNDLNLISTYCFQFPSPSTRYVAKRELLAANEYKKLNTWNRDDSMTYFRNLETSLHPNTILLRGRRLNGFFNWLVEQKKVRLNPINLKSLPKVRLQTMPKALTSNETEVLLKKIPKATWIGCRDRLAVSLMLICGYRISTVCALDWDNLEQTSDGWLLHTKGKGGVYTTRKLRPDIVGLIQNYAKKDVM